MHVRISWQQLTKRFAAIILTFTIGISTSFAINYRSLIQDTQLPDVFNVEIYRAPVDDGTNRCGLTVKLDKNHKLFINKDEFSNAESLGVSLSTLFVDRTINGVFRAGTNEIEKTIIVNVNKSTSYTDLTKLIRGLKKAGANPIQLCIDDCLNSVKVAKVHTPRVIERKKYIAVVNIKLNE